jgi:hypothetical protein
MFTTKWRKQCAQSRRERRLKNRRSRAEKDFDLLEKLYHWRRKVLLSFRSRIVVRFSFKSILSSYVVLCMSRDRDDCVNCFACLTADRELLTSQFHGTIVLQSHFTQDSKKVFVRCRFWLMRNNNSAWRRFCVYTTLYVNILGTSYEYTCCLGENLIFWVVYSSAIICTFTSKL